MSRPTVGPAPRREKHTRERCRDQGDRQERRTTPASIYQVERYCRRENRRCPYGAVVASESPAALEAQGRLRSAKFQPRSERSHRSQSRTPSFSTALPLARMHHRTLLGKAAQQTDSQSDLRSVPPAARSGRGRSRFRQTFDTTWRLGNAGSQACCLPRIRGTDQRRCDRPALLEPARLPAVRRPVRNPRPLRSRLRARAG